MPDQEIKLTTKQADVLRNKISSATNDNAKTAFYLCGLLYESFVSVVNTDKGWKFVWEYWGFKCWFDFVETEIGIHENTAYLYKRIWEIFGIELAGAWDLADVLPITKMRILSAADINKRNVSSWLSKARRMTCCELQAEVYGTEVMHTLSIRVSKRELQAINKAFDIARDEYESPKVTRGELLLDIVKEWQESRVKNKSGLKLPGLKVILKNNQTN